MNGISTHNTSALGKTNPFSNGDLRRTVDFDNGSALMDNVRGLVEKEKKLLELQVRIYLLICPFSKCDRPKAHGEGEKAARVENKVQGSILYSGLWLQLHYFCFTGT